MSNWPTLELRALWLVRAWKIGVWPPHPGGVHISASVDVGAAIEEEAGGVQEAVFGGDVEKRRAT